MQTKPTSTPHQAARRPYTPPQLSVYGSVANLTADLPGAKLGVSDIT